MNELTVIAQQVAKGLDLQIDGANLVETLKRTAFKQNVNDDQMFALLVIAKQYGLNPWTKEIYAFPDKGGIVPIVGVDGWMRIINSHPQFDGLEFEQDDESCTCIIYRKDRNHPTKVTEFMAECKRANTGPWQTHPRRMLRHKALIQAARMAFGFAGIYDEDEADRIKESTADQPMRKIEPTEPAYYEQAEFEAKLGQWRGIIESGRHDANSLIAMIESKGKLFTVEQKMTLASFEPVDANFEEVAE